MPSFYHIHLTFNKKHMLKAFIFKFSRFSSDINQFVKIQILNVNSSIQRRHHFKFERAVFIIGFMVHSIGRTEGTAAEVALRDFEYKKTERQKPHNYYCVLIKNQTDKK